MIRNKPNNHIKIFIISIILLFSTQLNATTLDIEVFKVGPNPLIIGRDHLIVNFTSSVITEGSFYVYSATGELVFSSNSIINAGDNKFILASSGELSSIKPQLYVLYALFTDEINTITKKAYFIAK